MSNSAITINFDVFNTSLEDGTRALMENTELREKILTQIDYIESLRREIIKLKRLSI